MEEVKIKAIVAKSADYREKDKIVTLYSLELGLISVIIKNCRQSAYKLKFAYSTFSFAEFEIFKKDDVLFMKTATLIDNFYPLCEDYDKFVIASEIIEILNKTSSPLSPNQILFINTLKTLNNLTYNDVNPKIILLKYLLGVVKNGGFRLNFKVCNSCGFEYINKIFLNLGSGEFECGSCQSPYSIFVEIKTFNLLKKINNTDVDNLGTLCEDKEVILDAIKLMELNLENRFSIKLNSKNF